MVIPVSFASPSRERMSFAGLLCVFVLTLCAGTAVLRAQGTLLPDSPYPPAPVPVTVPAPTPALALTPSPVPANLDAAPAADASTSSPGLKHDISGSAHGRNAQRNASQGFSLWDHTLLDAGQHGGGARVSRSSALGEQSGSSRASHGSWGAESGPVRADPSLWGGEPDDLESLFQGANAPSFGHSRGFGGVGPGMNGAHGSMPGDLKLDQLTRGDRGMYLKSSMGNFRFSYRDALSARSNGMGGGVGQGSAGASFNSSTFGNGMFTTMLGSGSTAGSSRGGFSSGSMSGRGHGGPSNPGGTEKHPTASVSLHLHF
jgi:hypothetical protein